MLKIESLEGFRAVYLDCHHRLMSYGPNHVGSHVFAEKLGILSDTYPDWAAIVDAEIELLACH